jgi:NADH dehydrogenase
MAEYRPHVVIIGGGFGGLNAALALRNAPVRITLIDRNNHHLFQPLLYQVATAGLAAPDIAAPIRKILRGQDNVTVLMGEVETIDTAQRSVQFAGTELDYDHLVVAVGVVNHWFGNDDWAAHAPGLKTIDDALDIRRRILLAFESAERESDPSRRAEWLTFAVVGGGPTGVELAGSIIEVATHALARDFRTFDPRSARVVLVEGGDRILPAFPEDLSAKASIQLASLGVEVRTDTRVTNITAEGVHLGETLLRARTVVWGAGVRASPILGALGVPLDRSGRVLVEPDLSIPGHPEVTVIGDAAALQQGDAWVPGVAPAAMQGGKHVARNIRRALKQQPPEPFRYADKGSLATIGRRAAVADFGRLRFSGFVAWLLWMLVHVLFLIGFRNKAAVMMEWAWAYLTYQRSARVILR